MDDPLSQVVQLLQPRAAFANVISGKGRWAVRYSAFGLPSFCIMLEGRCRLKVERLPALTLAPGDFVLLPRTPAFTISSLVPGPVVRRDPAAQDRERGELRYGTRGGEPDMRSLGGAFTFQREEPAVLLSLLPLVVHVRDAPRLGQLVQMVAEETVQLQPAHDFARMRLMDLLLVEALRASMSQAPPGLLRGLGDAQIRAVIEAVHAQVADEWSIARMARIATMSRSAFFERFARLVGMSPMDYLQHWRVEQAKSHLADDTLSVSEIAQRVGYASLSAFSAAFRREVGLSPRAWRRAR